MATRSPWAANARAMARPMPREAPVTRIARPVTDLGRASRVQPRHEPPRTGRGDLLVVCGDSLPLVRAEGRVERLAVGEVQLGLAVIGLLPVDRGHEPGGLGPLQARDL